MHRAGSGGRVLKELVEPLADSAPLAWAEAPRRCYRDAATGETCLWYHRVWQYLRLLDVIRTTRTNTDFLVSQFGKCARGGDHSRVLVAASADYSMLAHLRAAYDGESALQVSLVDRCGTSLMLNRWYADRYAMSLETTGCDLLAYRTDRPFDLVCTHNLLGRFDTESRRQLIAGWRAVLRPGGAVITTQRIRPNAEAGLVRYTEEEARDLGARVATLARATSPPGVDPEALGHAVYEYALRKGGHAILANHDITRPFEEEGFEIELADEGGGAAERDRDRPSSTAGPDTYRMRLVARRR